MQIMFAGKPFEKLRNIIEPVLKGHSIRIVDEKNLASEISWADVVVLRPMKFGDDILEAADRLKLVQQWGVGVEGIDVQACSRRGIYVCNVPSRGTGNAESVAETAILHMLLLSRRFFRSQEKMREGKIFTPPGKALWGKTACVIGLGDLGRCVTERLVCLGMEVTGVNRTIRDEFPSWGLKKVFPFSELKEGLAEADYVVLCLALNQATIGIIGKNELAMMKREAFLINVARGGLVERPALEEALNEGQIAGAGLDVLWDEPHDPKDPLLEDRKVTLTPHIGGVTDVSVTGIRDFIAANIDRVARGERPSSCLDPNI